MTTTCPCCGTVLKDQVLSDTDIAHYKVDIGIDSQMSRKIRLLYTTEADFEILALQLSRSHFWAPEIIGARQLALRNSGGVLLNQLGLGHSVENIQAMLSAGMKERGNA